MLIYAVLLCAIVAITYLIQFQAYNKFHDIDLGTDLCELIGVPIENKLN